MHKMTCSLVLACLIPFQIACVKRVIVKQDSQSIKSKLIYVTLVSGGKLELTDPDFLKEHLAGTLRADGQKIKIPLDEIASIEAVQPDLKKFFIGYGAVVAVLIIIAIILSPLSDLQLD